MSYLSNFKKSFKLIFLYKFSQLQCYRIFFKVLLVVQDVANLPCLCFLAIKMFTDVVPSLTHTLNKKKEQHRLCPLITLQIAPNKPPSLHFKQSPSSFFQKIASFIMMKPGSVNLKPSQKSENERPTLRSASTSRHQRF